MAMTTIPVDSVAFSCPVITAKVYIVKGPSGWTETFDRCELDVELARFLHPVPPRDMANVFVDMRATMDKPEVLSWHTVLGFLARTLNVSPHSIPPTVGIAFWAAVELAKHEKAAN